MNLLQKIPSWLKNKYFLTALGFAIWVLFFDERDFITTQFRHREELMDLQQSRKYYEARIAATREELQRLKTDPAVIEKLAREKFLMKRENEDLFLVPQK